MPRIYGAPSYQLGKDQEHLVKAAANAPVTSAQAQRGKAELAKMRRSLASWLKFRTLNDRVASGQPIKRPLFKRPGAVPLPPKALAARLSRQRHEDEQELATQLHQLLSEVFDPAQLPNPNVAQNPKAAVQLAVIAISGKLPGEGGGAEPTGAPVWMWPLVIVVGVIGFVIMTSIRSSADVAKERERLECIKAGACTDSGFFLKVASVAAIAWFAWEKLGVGARVKGALSK